MDGDRRAYKDVLAAAAIPQLMLPLDLKLAPTYRSTRQRFANHSRHVGYSTLADDRLKLHRTNSPLRLDSIERASR